jgi:polysaccharide pyruvyl transferase WcaK-like protein
MTGDCAWYDPDSFNENMHRPTEVQDVVFTTPHSSHYKEQAIDMVDMLVEEFPDATLHCSFHSKLTEHEEEIRTTAKSRGFKIVNAANDLSAIDFYSDADLHVGYRVHGHVAFLRKRRPSLLLSEDGRGIGFSESLGHKKLPAFSRHITGSAVSNSTVQKFLRRTIEQRRLASSTLVEETRHYIQEERDNDFRRLQHISDVIDETYSNMRAVINSIEQ